MSDAIMRLNVLKPEGPAVISTSASAFPALGNQASLAGAVKRLTERFNAAPARHLPLPPPAIMAASPSLGLPPATSVLLPPVGLPTLPSFPSDPADLRMIEKAQRAVVIGPIDQGSLRELVVLVGSNVQLAGECS